MIDKIDLIEQLGRLIGHDRVFPFDSTDASLHRHIVAGSGNGPLVVVKPTSTKQVQSVVRLAGTMNIAVSSTPNSVGNGAMLVADERPAVLLDLSDMNEIREINTESGYALVEPGVSFDQLHDALRSASSPFWIDADANGANSVCGSIAERAYGYSPYGDHLLMQCGMEVVTADGEVTRTGMGAVNGSDTWQLFKYNYGPYLDGLFSRANFGIITQVGLWLMPAPPATLVFAVSLPDLEAVSHATEIMRDLKIQMVVPGTVVISHRDTDDQLIKRSGETSATQTADWHLYGAIYGLPANNALIFGDVKNRLSAISGAKIDTDDLPPALPSWPIRSRMMHGEPAYSDNRAAANQDLWFTVSAPIEGESITAIHAAVTENLSSAGGFTLEFQLTWRTLFARIDIPANAENRAKQRDAALATINALAEQGYAVTHETRELTRLVRAQQTSASMQALTEQLTQALDPSARFTERQS